MRDIDAQYKRHCRLPTLTTTLRKFESTNTPPFLTDTGPLFTAFESPKSSRLLNETQAGAQRHHIELMTGFSALPLAEDGGNQEDGPHLVGTSKILGPGWLQLPALTVGLLGVQVLWSVEMSYGTHLYQRSTSKSQDWLQEHHI